MSAPLCSERESHTNKGKPNDHIPGANAGDWVTGGSDIEDHNPDKAYKKGSNHGGGEPARAF